MIVFDLFNRKLINNVTPYHRSYGAFEAYKSTDGELTIAPFNIPFINSAVVFLQKGDVFIIDNIEELQSLPYIDYQLIGDDKSSGTYKLEFDQFVSAVKLHIGKFGKFQFQIENKVVLNSNIHIIFKIVEKDNI